jgi:glucose/arabinose dehydrogenase
MLVCGVTAACGGNRPSQPETGPGGSGVQISGGERLAWDQRAGSPAELGNLRFILYIDGNRADLSDTSCGGMTGDQATCSGRLPSMSPGEHTLELSAQAGDGSESGRSSPLRVTVVRSATRSVSGTTPAPGPATEVGDGLILREVASGLDDPTDLAVLADGRVLVAERAGRIRVLDAGVWLEPPALVLDDVQLNGRAGGLLGLVSGPDFDRSGFVYVVYTADDGFRLARFRESNNSLREPVVLLDRVPASAVPAAALRFGPDGKLYLALDDGGDPSRAGDFGSYNGKVLRLNPDGSVPADQAGLTPVFTLDIGAARGFDWDLEAKTLWVAEGTSRQPGLLAAIVDENARSRRGRIATRYALPDRTAPSSVLLYRHALMASWTGDLLVALPDAGQLLRLKLGPGGSGNVVLTEKVLDGTAGSVRALGATGDGVIYLANDTSLFTLTPDAFARGL